MNMTQLEAGAKAPSATQTKADRRVTQLSTDALEELAARRRSRETGLPHDKKRIVNGRPEPHGPYQGDLPISWSGL